MSSSFDKKSEFYKLFNNFKPSDSEDSAIHDISNIINSKIISSKDFNSDKQQQQQSSFSIKDTIFDSNAAFSNNKNSTNIKTTNETLKVKNPLSYYIQQTQLQINNNKSLEKDIDKCFLKLNTIIQERDQLTTVLKEFSNQTQEIIDKQEKCYLLSQSIDKILKYYTEPKSILAFFENTKNLVESQRFLTDYETIEYGISFFNLHLDYIESESYLREYKTLKQISISKFSNYLNKSINYFENNVGYVIPGKRGSSNSNNVSNASGLDLNKHSSDLELFQESFLNSLPLAKNMSSKIYLLPANFSKIKTLQKFFEKKAKYDYDIVNCLNNIKKTFISNRITLIRPFYLELLNNAELLDNLVDIPSNISGNENKIGVKSKKSDTSLGSNNCNIMFTQNNNELLVELLKITICEMFYFKTIFQTKLTDNYTILNDFIYDLFNTMYNTLRPIIVKTEKIDLICYLFNRIISSFELVFLNNNNITVEEFEKKLFQLKTRSNSFPQLTPIIGNIIHNNNNDSNTTGLSIMPETNRNSNNNENYSNKSSFIIDSSLLQEFLKLSNDLISPIILKLIKDLQEKLYFTVSYQIKYSLIEFENQFQNYEVIHKNVKKNYNNFNLFHEFLKNTCLLLDLLSTKLDKEIVSELAVACVAQFLEILYKEAREKTVTYEFQIYLVQQIVLVIKLVEEFNLEIRHNKVSFDLYTFTDMLRQNISITKNHNVESTSGIKEAIFNSGLSSGVSSVRNVISSVYSVGLSVPSFLNGLKFGGYSGYIGYSGYNNFDSNGISDSSLISLADDEVKVFKKSLYNILFKSYKILIQLVNEFIFGKENVDKLALIKRRKEVDLLIKESNYTDKNDDTKINNTEQTANTTNTEMDIINNNNTGAINEIIDITNLEIEGLYDKFSEVLNSLKDELYYIDECAFEKIAHMILESINKIVESLYKNINDERIRDFLWSEIENSNLIRIKNSICNVKNELLIKRKNESSTSTASINKDSIKDNHEKIENEIVL